MTTETRTETLAEAMDEAFTYEDDDNAKPTLRFVDDHEAFWRPFAAKVAAILAAVNRADEGDSRLREALREQRPYAAYSKNRTHGVHINEDHDCREYVVGECFIDAALAASDRADPAPAALDVERLADEMPGSEFRFYRDSNGAWWGKVHRLGGGVEATASGDTFVEMLAALVPEYAAARPVAPDEPEGGR